MTKSPLTLILSALLVIVISVSCKKGDIGPTGAQGPQGIVGPAGAAGTIFFSGTTTPDPNLGKVGDYYIDLATSVLFGPKTTSGWGVGFSMKGDPGAAGQTGAAGSPGTKIYSGTGAPASSLGIAGDFYLDTVAHTFYGPKLTTGWGLPVALQGATGPAGPQGPQGPAGSANVQYTPWFTSVWVGANPIYFDQSVPAITPDILNYGTVLVFGNLRGYPASVISAQAVEPLPVTLTYTSLAVPFLPVPQTDVWEAFATSANIHVQFTNNATIYLPGAFPYQKSLFRLVIIPGGVAIPLNIGYKELKTYLHVNMPD